MNLLEHNVMPAKRPSKSTKAEVSAKSVRANTAKPRKGKVRMSKLELERLESFKALMEKYRGKCSFAGYDA